MKKLIVFEWVSLDGICDAESMNDWFLPYHSDARAACITEQIEGCDTMVYGRITYEMLAPYWSAQQNNEMGVADKLNNVPKYVAASTGTKTEWTNTTVLRENVVAEIARLKKEPGSYILIQGSATLVEALAEAGLVDEYRLLVHPVAAGKGKRFFKEGSSLQKLQLIESKTLDLGVQYLSYKPA